VRNAPVNKSQNEQPRRVYVDQQNIRQSSSSADIFREARSSKRASHAEGVTIEISADKNGHPTYILTAESRKEKLTFVVVKRFSEFQRLHDRIASLSSLKRVYQNRLPPKYMRVKLSADEVSQRSKGLELWFGEVFYRSRHEGWSVALVRVVTDFLQPPAGHTSSLSAASLAQFGDNGSGGGGGGATSMTYPPLSPHPTQHTTHSLRLASPPPPPPQRESGQRLRATSTASSFSVTSAFSVIRRSSLFGSCEKPGGLGGELDETLMSRLQSDLGFAQLEDAQDVAAARIIFEGRLHHFCEAVGGGASGGSAAGRGGEWKACHLCLIWCDASRAEALLLRFDDGEFTPCAALALARAHADSGGGDCGDRVVSPVRSIQTCVMARTLLPHEAKAQLLPPTPTPTLSPLSPLQKLPQPQSPSSAPQPQSPSSASLRPSYSSSEVCSSLGMSRHKASTACVSSVDSSGRGPGSSGRGADSSGRGRSGRVDEVRDSVYSRDYEEDEGGGLYRFVLSLVGGASVGFAAASSGGRAEWLGIVYSTLIRQAAAGNHDDVAVVRTVERAASSWRASQLDPDGTAWAPSPPLPPPQGRLEEEGGERLEGVLRESSLLREEGAFAVGDRVRWLRTAALSAGETVDEVVAAVEEEEAVGTVLGFTFDSAGQSVQSLGGSDGDGGLVRVRVLFPAGTFELNPKKLRRLVLCPPTSVPEEVVEVEEEERGYQSVCRI